MSHNDNPTYSPQTRAVMNDFLPICHEFAVGRFAISVGGSTGKGTWDSQSDVDFRLFCDGPFPTPEEKPAAWQAYLDAMETWKQRGIFVDGIWMRTIGEIDAALARWINGEIAPPDLIWTVWGYHVLPDIFHQAPIEDPHGVIAGWKEQLRVFPPRLKQALLKKHVDSARYWQADYHYRSKVGRGDVVFLAGLTSQLVHDLIQILFALNEEYFVGDGSNLKFVEKFAIKPENFAGKVAEILYPPDGPERLQRQYNQLSQLIDEVAGLVK